MPQPPRLLVGTTKGLFILQNAGDGADWSVSGPFCDGWPVNHAIGDAETGAIWAAGGNEWYGAGVWHSADGSGEAFALTKLANGKFDAWLAEDPEMAAHFGRAPDPPARFTGEIDALWSLGRVNGTLYAGAKPATLFASHDGGGSWQKVQGLSDHPSSDSWQPGGAGLTLHTIVTDPDDPARIWVGISAAGVFASEDGGATWDRRNRRSNAAAHGHGHGDPHEVGHCVHNMARTVGPDGAEVLYQQNHHGVFRSGDGGRSWDDITAGLPSDFGFPVAAHPRDPATLWVLPLNGDSIGRFPPGASAAVWRSRDGGATWTDLRDGLPGANCFFTVLRQAMSVDRQSPAGIYFGTNSGSVFASRDEGDTWHEIARHLPTVLCVETVDAARG